MGSEKDEYVSMLDIQIQGLQEKLSKVGRLTDLEADAIEYTMSFMANLPHLWSNTSVDTKIIFQDIIFYARPAYDLSTNMFGTVEIKPLCRLLSNEKDAKASSNNSLVTLLESNWNLICGELLRWYDLFSRPNLVSSYTHLAWNSQGLAPNTAKVVDMQNRYYTYHNKYNGDKKNARRARTDR